MCVCELTDDVHWYVDKIHVPYLYLIAESPEEAEHALRSWAGKVLRVGHMSLDVRITAARILSCHLLIMTTKCTPIQPIEFIEW